MAYDDEEEKERERRIASSWGDIEEERRYDYIVRNDEEEINYFNGTISEDGHDYNVTVDPIRDGHEARISISHRNDCEYDHDEY